MKYKNIGGMFLSTQPDQQKRPKCKNAQKKKKKFRLSTSPSVKKITDTPPINK